MKMNNKGLVVVGAVAMAVAASASADMHKPPATRASMQDCLTTVLAKHPGEPLQVVLKMEGKEPVWEFELAGKDGKLWDIECSGNSGKIVETEERVNSPDDAAFKAKAKVGEEAAMKTALEKYPGEVERTEYEIESDGKISYEFDIKLKAGGEMRVEVDGTSGQIVEASREYVDVGRLPK